MGPQLATPHLTASDLFNANALFWGHIPMIRVVRIQQPLPYGHWRNLQSHSQSALAAANFNGATQGRKVGGFHGRR